MENEMIILKDEAENEYPMQLIERFDHEGETFVVLTEAHHECGCGCDDCHDDCEGEGGNVYVMKEAIIEGEHCYSQVEEEKIDGIIDIVRHILGIEDECGCGCDECSGHCDCEG